MFQSSPNPKVGRIRRSRRRAVQRHMVSILAQPEGRAHRAVVALTVAGLDVSILAQPEGRAHPRQIVSQTTVIDRFQSSPNPKVGRIRLALLHRHPLERVSILAQPEGRAHHLTLAAIGRLLRPFQSSPNPKVGRIP